MGTEDPRDDPDFYKRATYYYSDYGFLVDVIDYREVCGVDCAVLTSKVTCQKRFP